jgi:hypothetical protein
MTPTYTITSLRPSNQSRINRLLKADKTYDLWVDKQAEAEGNDDTKAAAAAERKCEAWFDRLEEAEGELPKDELKHFRAEQIKIQGY